MAATLFVVGPSPADGRTLHWRSLEVSARLDAAGALHVRERHAMVFSGDWNGGERTFDVRPGQELELSGVRRIDPGTGATIPLREGDLSQVDHYAWHDRRTLRWRSRLPSEAAFDETEITYELEYRLTGVLVRAGAGYRLDHDFAFPDRVGQIESFRLDLELDSIWRAPAGFPSRLERGPLQPGQSVFVTGDLAYRGTGEPEAALTFTPDWVRLLPLGLALLAVVWMARSFIRHETEQGRFLATDAPDSLDRTWLQEKVFSLRPEEVGALWDGTVGASEVSALIARWAQEGRVKSSVRQAGGFFKRAVLELELTAERDSFAGYERRLLDKLFFSGRTRTDTEAIRKRYSKTGFSPASTIRASIERRLRDRKDTGKKISSPDKTPGCLLLLAFVACLALEFWTGGDSAAILAVTLLVAGLAPAAAGLVLGYRYSRQADRQNATAPWLALPLVALLALLVLATLAPGRIGAFEQMRLGVGGLLATGLFFVLVAASVLSAARSRESRQRVARRKQLARARRFFADELGRAAPQLDDAWMPYLLAFGLDRSLDRWFRSYGAAAAGRVAANSTFSGGSGSSTSTWTGGGGAFGGAGATAAWTAAAGGIAAGVSRPSSGSSGGGSSGGGGSGGGGGGGW